MREAALSHAAPPPRPGVYRPSRRVPAQRRSAADRQWSERGRCRRDGAGGARRLSARLEGPLSGRRRAARRLAPPTGRRSSVRPVLGEELRRLGTWSERHRRLLARILLAVALSIVIDFVCAALLW